MRHRSAGCCRAMSRANNSRRWRPRLGPCGNPGHAAGHAPRASRALVLRRYWFRLVLLPPMRWSRSSRRRARARLQGGAVHFWGPARGRGGRGREAWLAERGYASTLEYVRAVAIRGDRGDRTAAAPESRRDVLRGDGAAEACARRR